MPEGTAKASQPEATPITAVPAPMTPPTLLTAQGVQGQLGSSVPDSEFFGSGSSAGAEPAFENRIRDEDLFDRTLTF